MIPRKIEIIEKHEDYWIIKPTSKGIGGGIPITDGESIMISGGVVGNKDTGYVTVYRMLFIFNDKEIHSNQSAHK